MLKCTSSSFILKLTVHLIHPICELCPEALFSPRVPCENPTNGQYPLITRCHGDNKDVGCFFQLSRFIV